jgi:hypothetical protein
VGVELGVAAPGGLRVGDREAGGERRERERERKGVGENREKVAALCRGRRSGVLGEGGRGRSWLGVMLGS